MKEALNYFSKMAKGQNITPTSVKNIPANDFTSYDAEFILRYATSQTHILDLASGTGLTINKIYDKVNKITAVEPFESFTKFIQQSPNIEVYNQTLSDFEPKGEYDLLTFFGIMQFFTEEEALRLYKKYFSALKKGGKIIIKHQFGVKEDIFVAGYSEELKTEYFSHYRHLDKEMTMLKNTGYKNAEAFDIYPPECNRWENTHFYAIVADK
jgi:cyclopropane fatty-acyl-phospholipid synthase-like methyltransferase